MEASWYDKLEDNNVLCRLCPNDCVIPDGRHGICKVRVNRGGVLTADSYAELVTLAADPIEKKPLYHYYPSRSILSTGPNGCNFQCGYCQNSDISQRVVPTRHVTPEELAEFAAHDDSIGVAYTYTEPFIWSEYIRDAGACVHERGLKNVLVTNGYVHEEPLRELLPLIDAMNVDIKSMNEDFYRDICGGILSDVLNTVEVANGSCHVEITNLVITGYNDSEDDIARLADWIAGVNPAIPLHLSRYFPRYRFSEKETPVSTLLKAHEIASSRLKYVYLGNLQMEGGSDTDCPVCGNVLVSRSHYSVQLSGIRDSVCSSCGAKVDIVGV